MLGKQRVYGYMIGNIWVMGAARTAGRLDGEGFGGEIHGPEHHSGSVEVETAGVHNAEDFSTVQGEVARGHGHAESRDAGEAAGPGHVVEAGASVEVMAAAGASAHGGAKTVVAVGKRMAADTDDQVRVHSCLRRVN